MTYIILIVLAIICYLANNNTVTFAILVLLSFKLTMLDDYVFPFLQKWGIHLGIILLTASMLVPIANGKIPLTEILKAFVNWQSILAIIVGIFVSWLGMKGVILMSGSPLIITGLIIGTIIGVAFFKGIPVGPLIAAGIVSLFIGVGK